MNKRQLKKYYTYRDSNGKLKIVGRKPKLKLKCTSEVLDFLIDSIYSKIPKNNNQSRMAGVPMIRYTQYNKIKKRR